MDARGRDVRVVLGPEVGRTSTEPSPRTSCATSSCRAGDSDSGSAPVGVLLRLRSVRAARRSRCCREGVTESSFGRRATVTLRAIVGPLRPARLLPRRRCRACSGGCAAGAAGPSFVRLAGLAYLLGVAAHRASSSRSSSSSASRSSRALDHRERRGASSPASLVGRAPEEQTAAELAAARMAPSRRRRSLGAGFLAAIGRVLRGAPSAPSDWPSSTTGTPGSRGR